MAPPQHTYGPTCQLAGDIRAPAHTSGESRPAVKAQFFYQSAFPIDDPLSAVPPPSSTTGSAATKHPIRPFAPHDNAALEEAWQQLGTTICGEKGWEGTEPGVAEGNASGRGRMMESGVTVEKRGRDRVGLEDHHDGGSLREMRRIQASRRNERHTKEHKKRPFESTGDGQEHVTPARTGFSRTDDVKEVEMDKGNVGVNRPVTAMTFDVSKSSKMTPPEESQTSNVISAMSYPPSRVGLSNKTTTGTPFLRAPPRRRRSLSPSPETDGNVDRPESERHGKQSVSGTPSSWGDYVSDDYEPFNASEVTDPKASSLDNQPGDRANESIEVPVGISRLHVVELPDLEMKPIYWSPVNDLSSVIRGTWFYKDNMFPVEAEVANQLEIGYLELKVWTETWNDELNSAVAVGAEGEAKVVYRIWPKEESKKAQDDNRTEPAQETRTTRGSVALTRTEDLLVRSTGSNQPSDGLSHVAAEGHHDSVKGKGRRYASSGVIYKNEREAFILRPSLLPSAYYGRRPLAKIRRGFVVGIPIVRGFNWKTWDRIHPSKKTLLSARAEEGAEACQSGAANVHRGRGCPACLGVERQPKVTDLVFVIHGIGQKLSQRIESYSFTHLVNSLRRQIHVELGNPVVKGLLRPGHGGIMTLPINWRALLSFDENAISDNNQAGKKHAWANEFGLRDITPETIPSVRNLISDVMLDIPYYLSHHKSEMVEAVIGEANRVYRLWCKNNPDFEKTGRVHLIAHSLGSVMTLDILSKQPTRLPENIDLTSPIINTHRFDFDTKSLFFCGSPVGFFLLLNKASLLPRKGRNKPGADGEDAERRVAGEANTYGCLAIDNIYNVLNHYDPIAYRLNATVDTTYASSLKPALLPSATTSFLTSLTTTLLGSSSDPSSQNRPLINRLQSTIELETHNFTREEIAEKRMYLLNDNGQIDYFLPTGGGPLEIQYLNILSAHSSYWTSRDFVRFLVLEIGRPQGRENTLGNMRAVKVGRKT